MFSERRFLETQNEKATDALYETSMQIKKYSLMLREQADEQNQQLDDMENQMEMADKQLKRTIYNMQHMSQHKWQWITLLCIGLLIFLW